MKKFKRSLSLLLTFCLLLTLLPGLAFAANEASFNPYLHYFWGEGRVYDGVTGEPFEGANVWIAYWYYHSQEDFEDGNGELRSYHTTTDSNGYYNITFKLDIDLFLVGAHGFQAESPQMTVNPHWGRVWIDSVSLQPSLRSDFNAADEAGIEPAAYGRFTGRGSVFNGVTGEPFEGAEIWLSYSFFNEEGYEEWVHVHTTTCVDGFYELSFSMPLASPLTVWAPGFSPEFPEIHVNRWWVMIDDAYLQPEPGNW